MTRRYSDEKLIERLQKLARELGKTPSVSDVNDHDDMPNRSTFRSRFGTWNEALTAAGLEPNQTYRYGREELLTIISELADQLGRRPTRRDLEKHTDVSEGPFRTEFGSWGNALRVAGFSENPRVSDKELIGALRDFSNYSGEEGVVWTPTKREMDAKGPYSASLYADRFGSWTQAVVEAGLNPDTRRVPSETLLDELERLGELLGERPSCQQMAQHGDYSFDAYVRAFGSWKNALQEGGYEPPPGGRPQQTFEFSTGELVAELRRIARKWGRPPTEAEFNDHAVHSSTTYINRFGSWQAALKRASLELQRDTPSARTDSRLFDGSATAQDELNLSAGGDHYRLRTGDGLGDYRSGMVYEIVSMKDEEISAWPVGFNGELRRTFKIEELEGKLAGRSRTLKAGGRFIVQYPNWQHPEFD